MRFSGGDARRFEEVASLPGTFFAYNFEKEEILTEDCTRFLEFFDIQRIATAGVLHRMFGRWHFVVSGFDEDERDLHEIPEVRKFFQRLVTRWPNFFYAVDLKDGFLRELFWCMLPNIASTTHPDHPTKTFVVMPTKEGNAAYRQLIAAFVEVCKKDPQMNREVFDRRVADIRAYFNRMVSPL